MAEPLKYRRSVRITWVASYAALVAVPTLVFLLVSWTTSRVLEDQLTESNRTLVDLMGREIDGKLEYVGRLLNDLTWDPLAQSLMNQSKLSEGIQRFDMVRLSDNMTLYAGYNRFGDLFFIHFPQLGGVLMPRAYYTFDRFQSTYFPALPLPSPGLATLVDRRQDGTSTPMVYIDALGHFQKAVLILKSLPPSPSSPVMATIGVAINTDAVINSLHSAVQASRSEVRIVNGNGEVILTTLRGKEPESVSNGTWRMGGESYTLLQRHTQLFGWTVQLLVPDLVIKEKLLITQLIIVAGFLACVGFGAWLTVYLLRRNYGPVRRLIDNLSAGGAPTWDHTDEFTFIGQAAARPLREALAGRILRGQTAQGSGISWEDSLAALDIVFPTNSFVVILVHSDEESLARAGAGTRIHHAFQAALEPAATVLKSPEDQPLTFLLCLNTPGDAAVIPELQAKMATVGQILEAQEEVKILTAVSAVVEGLAAVPLALRQAQTALEYRFVVGGAHPVAWGELNLGPSSVLYHFDLDDESRLMTAVKAGDQGAALAILDKVFAENGVMGTAVLSPQAVRCLAWDLGTSLLKALAEITGDDHLTGLFEPVSALAQNPQLEKVHQGLTEITKEACAMASGRNSTRAAHLKSEASRQFLRQVCTYLETQFRDPSLNLAKVADAQSLTPAYLSRLFRENMEEGLLDYLARIRIERAKSLLRDTDGNLQEIGAATGFSDVKTFIRTFRKVSGTTPGKYRETAK